MSAASSIAVPRVRFNTLPLLIALLLRWDEEALLDFASRHTVLNASVTTLRRHGAQWELADFSDVRHLQREGAEVTVHPGSADVEPE